MTDHAPAFNLKAVIRETGLTPETLRAWERRYGLVKPQRTPGGHRLYSQYDIQMLKWLVARQREGLSISRAVEMWRSMENNGQDPLEPARPQPRSIVIGGMALDDLRQAWVSACLEFDEESAERALTQGFAIASPETVCIDVIQKGLAEIGNQWYRGMISVQQEHFASALSMRRLHALFAASPSPTRPERILAACPAGEEHEFGLLVISFLLRRRGWDVVYLGANVPLARLGATLQVTSPRLVVSVTQTLPGAASLREMAETTRSYGIPLAYGGSLFVAVPSLIERIPGYFLGNEIAAVPKTVEHLLAAAPPLPQIAPAPLEFSQARDYLVEKEPFIVASVCEALRSTPIASAHLEIANSTFTRYLIAALSLGDFRLLGHTIGWLDGLLENYGLPSSQADYYFEIYRRAVEQNPDVGANLILSWLGQLKRNTAV